MAEVGHRALLQAQADRCLRQCRIGVAPAILRQRVRDECVRKRLHIDAVDSVARTVRDLYSSVMSLKYELLGELLVAAAGRGEQLVQLSFAEIAAVVDGLPPSARKHRPWWANGGQSHSSVWLSAGWRVDSISLEQQWVRFARVTDDGAQPGAAPTSEPRRAPRAQSVATRTVPPSEPDSQKTVLVLIGCVKTKRPIPVPAKDLYDSALFARRRAYAQNSGVPWFILSSQWGLLDPEQVVAPYEMYLADQPAGYRRAWGWFVTEQLVARFPIAAGDAIEIHAGDAYAAALREPFAARAITLLCPVGARSIGQTLQWYDQLGGSDSTARDEQQQAVDPSPVLAMTREALTALSSSALALTPGQLRGGGWDELTRPGLYSWWVDAAGAEDLSDGLGIQLEPGLIYAGQAGATRWPSGRRSANTLRDRIVGMHLDGSIEFSTFRKTLAAILQRGAGNSPIDEGALSTWMSGHLSAAIWPTSTPDLLHEVESAVLRELDPPLNLKSMAPTSIRDRIRQLRTGTAA